MDEGKMQIIKNDHCKKIRMRIWPHFIEEVKVKTLEHRNFYLNYTG